MTDKIISFGEKTNNGQIMTPREALEYALERMNSEGDNVFKEANKIMILLVDDDNNQYQVNWSQAGMKMSECVALCEIAKITVLSEMNYIKPE